MFKIKLLALAALAVGLLYCMPKASAQVSISIGLEPVCPYGYFDYPPYDCAPYGYYGPDWFVGGIFIGAGPWFHGPAHFNGHVDTRFDPRHGYKGPMPERGDQPNGNFHGNQARDGQGHTVKEDHSPSNEHTLPTGGHPSGGHPANGHPSGGGHH
jgi:hypothetical protein